MAQAEAEGLDKVGNGQDMEESAGRLGLAKDCVELGEVVCGCKDVGVWKLYPEESRLYSFYNYG